MNVRATLSDERLLDQALDGDPDALLELLERFAPAARSGLRIDRECRSVIDEDDIMQVTYMEAMTDFRHFRGTAHGFEKWLARIAENNLRDAIKYLTARRRYPHNGHRLSPSENGWSLHELAAARATTPHTSTAESDDLRSIGAAIDRLPADYARVLRRRLLEEATLAEVAKEMKRSHGAVALLEMRALARLRRRLGSISRFLGR